MSPSTLLARALVDELLRVGVRDVVHSPGSRNAPLSFALYDAAAAGALRLHTRLDERTAGFLALGLAKGSRLPTVVTCTSGTAVANLHPALLEARHAGVPLVALTADRPERLRGTSANQTTVQAGIFPTIESRDLDRPGDLGDWARTGPLHLNVQLDEPLLPDDAFVPRPVAEPERGPRFPGLDHPDATPIPAGPRTVVVAGDDAGPAARVLAQDGGWPLLAEPTSGSRTGANALRTYRLLLDTELGRSIERVVVCGHPTLSRPVSRLLARSDVEVWDVAGQGLWSPRPFAVHHTVASATAATEPGTHPAWLPAWHEADASVARQLDRLLAGEGLSPYAVAGAVARALPPGGLLHVGASSPIRDLDLMVPRYRVGDRRKLIANRGLAGIDGTVSTAIGAALARTVSSRALALMGDVTFLHDATGLFIGPGEARPDLMIVVVNDDGGSIFAMLEQGDPAYADRYDKLFGTPHGVDVEALCAASRTPHLRVTELAQLEQALANPNGGIEVVEAVVRRDDRRALDERIRALRPV